MSKGPESRQFKRAQVALEVHYRTRGSFLVSYSVNLSQGGIYLETNHQLPVGTQLTVRFKVPGVAQMIEAEATVVWLREQASAAQPAGMGLQFDYLDDHLGASIDRLVQDFTGVRIAVLASDSTTLDRLSRTVQSILACDVIPDTVSHILIAGFSARLDLALIDLDSAGKEGLKAISMAAEVSGGIPVIAITRNSELGDRAKATGAAALLGNPVPFEQLRELTLEVLGRPSQTTEHA